MASWSCQVLSVCSTLLITLLFVLMCTDPDLQLQLPPMNSQPQTDFKFLSSRSTFSLQVEIFRILVLCPTYVTAPVHTTKLFYHKNQSIQKTESLTMAPPKSISEAWKCVQRHPNNKLKCNLCAHNFTGSLTQAMYHLLSISNAWGVGVKGYPYLPPEAWVKLEKEYEILEADEEKKRRKAEDFSRYY